MTKPAINGAHESTLEIINYQRNDNYIVTGMIPFLLDIPKYSEWNGLAQYHQVLSPISNATLEGCSILRRRSFAGGNGLLGAYRITLFLFSLCFLLLQTCFPHHGRLYPLKLSARVNLSPLSCFFSSICHSSGRIGYYGASKTT